MNRSIFRLYSKQWADNVDGFFSRFLKSDIDVDALLIKSQPNLADCREVFSDDYYRDVYSIYTIHYYSMLEGKSSTNDSLRDKDVYRIKTSTLSDIKKGKHNLAGGISNVLNLNAFRPGKLNYHSITFTSNDSEHGTSFQIWVFLNGRWVFFPKPWKIVEVLHELKHSKKIKRIIQILRFLGLHKSFDGHDMEGVFAMTYLLKHLIKEK